MNLITLQFRMLHRRGENDGTPLFVDFISQLKALFNWVAEEVLQHRDDVSVGMVVIVEQDDVIRRLVAQSAVSINVGFW